MSLIEKIRSEYRKTCIVDKPERPDCVLSLRGISKPYLFIDLDLRGSPLGPNDKKCDFLVYIDNVGEMPCVASLEFKSTWRGKIVEQLQAGAKELEYRVPRDLQCRFRPIGVLGNFPKNKRKEIRQQVSFRDQEEPVRIIFCGDQLIKAILRKR
ncbi:MAG: hypothetical protein OXF06_10780 [Bacteroidetes bacterium]|nr:hypothetical protein [Bacteroidota bacterium]